MKDFHFLILLFVCDSAQSLSPQSVHDNLNGNLDLAIFQLWRGNLSHEFNHAAWCPKKTNGFVADL